jgi:3-hydroxy-3-methylglutaryl CoA synthase
MAGIAAYGAYVPITRLPLSLAAGRPAKEGGPERAVADYDEDAVTMAVTAAIDCLTGVPRDAVDAVYFASTSYPLREKQGAALIAKALDLRRDVLTQDHAGSLRAGTAALESAIHAVASGALRAVLVVASDCRLGAPRGALEAKLGDGAVALLVSADPIARFDASFSVADELQDVADRGRVVHTPGGPLRDPEATRRTRSPHWVGCSRSRAAAPRTSRRSRSTRPTKEVRPRCCAWSASRTSRSSPRRSGCSATPARRSR